MLPSRLMVTLVVLLVLSQSARTDVTEANADAKVVLVTPKQVHVTSVLKQDYEAMVGLPLLKNDTLTIPANATVALRLKNGHVVRLDDELELQVKDIALFNAPEKKEDVSKQLDRLLTEEEKAAGPSRLMGWNAGQTAANVKSSAEVERSAPKAKEKSVVAAATPAPPPPPSAPAPAPAPLEVAESSKSTVAPAAPAASVAMPARAAPGAGAGLGGIHGSRGGGAGAPALTADAQLTACINDTLPEQDAAFRRSLHGHLTLRLRNSTERLRVHFTNHLPVPECAKAWATEHRAQVAGSIDLDIPLK